MPTINLSFPPYSNFLLDMVCRLLVYLFSVLKHRILTPPTVIIIFFVIPHYPINSIASYGRRQQFIPSPINYFICKIWLWYLHVKIFSPINSSQLFLVVILLYLYNIIFDDVVLET